MHTSPDAVRRCSVLASFATLIAQNTPAGLMDVSDQYAADRFDPVERVAIAIDSALWGHGVLAPFSHEGHIEDMALSLAATGDIRIAAWMMNSNTLLTLALDRYPDKDYVMEPSALPTGIPSTLLGYPIYVNEFASDIIHPILFGVFQPHQIVVRYFVGQIEPVEYEAVYGPLNAPKRIQQKGMTARQVFVRLEIDPAARLRALKTNPAKKGKATDGN